MDQPMGSPPAGEPPRTAAPDSIREQDKVMLVLAYLPPLALIPWLAVGDSDYVRWHARQGVALTVVSTTWLILVTLVATVADRWTGTLLPVGCVGGGVLLSLSVAATLKAFEPSRWRIPLVSVLAEKF